MLDNFTITAFELGWQVKMLNIRYQIGVISELDRKSYLEISYERMLIYQG